MATYKSKIAVTLGMTIVPLILVMGAGATSTEKLLYEFRGGVSDGALPVSSLVSDKAGNLYGTTMADGRGPGAVHI